jgi:hypothetical protein
LCVCDLFDAIAVAAATDDDDNDNNNNNSNTPVRMCYKLEYCY